MEDDCDTNERRIEGIKARLWEYNASYVQIDPDRSIEFVYNLLVNNKLTREPETDTEYLYRGWWYYHIIKDRIKARENYLIAVDKGNTTAMYNLAMNYKVDEKDYDMMKIYFHMAIDNDSSESMNCLAFYYERIEQNYDMAKKYYIMALERGYGPVLHRLTKMYMLYLQNDYSFLDVYPTILDQISGFKDIDDLKADIRQNLIELVKDRFVGNIKLPREYRVAFCQLNLFNCGVSLDIRNKQYILKRTNIFPSNYDNEYMPAFMEMLLISNKSGCILPRDIMLLIAGMLFV